MRRRLIIIAITISAFGCTAIRQQKALTAVPDSAEFHNLQVLPTNITHDQLITTMRGFTRALGVSCDHCHVPRPGAEGALDFASDQKNEKNVARTMLRMVNAIDEDYISTVNVYGERVTCATCHRGKTIPDSTVPEAVQRPVS